MKKDTTLIRSSKVVSYAGAFMALLIGSGFATGQEILQYFASYGMQGLLVALMMLILFILISGCFIAAGKRENFAKGSDIFQYYCGKHIGTFYDYFTILFVFMSYIVMIAGAGATINEHFGLPTVLGSLLMMILVCVTTIFGLNGVINVIGKLGPFIAILAIVLGTISALSNLPGILENSALLAEGEITVKQVGNSWFSSATSYVGFCILWLAAFLTAMGKETNSVKEGVLGTTIGSIGFTIGCTTMMLGLLAHLPLVADSQIPALILAGRISPILSFCFSIIIFMGIFTTAVPLLWQVSSRFTVEGTPKFKITSIVCAVVGSLIALLLPFNSLVNIVYGINGYVGIILVFFIVVKEIRRLKTK